MPFEPPSDSSTWGADEHTGYITARAAAEKYGVSYSSLMRYQAKAIIPHPRHFPGSKENWYPECELRECLRGYLQQMGFSA